MVEELGGANVEIPGSFVVDVELWYHEIGGDGQEQTSDLVEEEMADEQFIRRRESVPNPHIVLHRQETARGFE